MTIYIKKKITFNFVTVQINLKIPLYDYDFQKILVRKIVLDINQLFFYDLSKFFKNTNNNIMSIISNQMFYGKTNQNHKLNNFD